MKTAPAAVPEQPQQNWVVYADCFADGRMRFGVTTRNTYKNEIQLVAAGNPDGVEKRIIILLKLKLNQDFSSEVLQAGETRRTLC